MPAEFPPRLAGRTALVTGAGNGLGRAIVLQLARSGVRVILVGRRESPLIAVAAEIAELDETVGSRVATCDTADPDSVDRLASELGSEQVSILVNNAGIGGPVADLVDIEPDDWDEVFDINVRGVYLMCRAFLPSMTAAHRGDVINVASVTGKRPLAHRTPYAASKMAVIGLTTTLAWEVGPLGVSVNSLSPGPVNGPRMVSNFTKTAAKEGISYDQAYQDYASRGALNRLLEEHEVGEAVVAMLQMPGLCGADIDLSAGMIAR